MTFRPSAVIPFRPRRTDRRLRLPGRVSPQVRVAQISGGPEFMSGEHFGRERWAELTTFRPEVLVGYGFDLERLALAAAQENLNLDSVNRAIFVLTDCGTHILKSTTRDLLWRAFSVPVLELIMAPGYSVLAAECEAHEGWHLQAGSTAALIDGELVCDAPPLLRSHTGFAGRIEATPCGCGRPHARLFDLQPFVKRYQTPAAAPKREASVLFEEDSPVLLPAS